MRNKRLQKRLNEKNQIIEQTNQENTPEQSAQSVKEKTKKPPKPPKKPKFKKNKTPVPEPQPVQQPIQPPVQSVITQPAVSSVPATPVPVASPKQSRIQKLKQKNQVPEQSETFDNLELGSVSKMKAPIPIKPILYKAGTIFLILCCVYMVFVTYGVFVTNYVYDSSGQVIAERMTIDDIRKNKEFNRVYDYYTRAREIYEKALLLDYQLSNNADDAIMIATEYEELLNPISTLSVQLEGSDVSSKYVQFKKMLLTWVQTDIAVYLQNMSAAISQNNSTKANQAIEYKEKTYNDFYIITQNLIALSEDVKNVDITGVREWSPSNYIEKHVTGLNSD